VYANMITLLEEALSGVKIIKSFNAVEFIKGRFNSENDRYATINRRMVRRQQMGSPVSELLGVFMVAVILLYGGHLVLSGQGDLEASAFIAYIAIFSQVMRPAKALTDAFSNIHSVIAAGARVRQLIDEQNRVADRPDARDIAAFRDQIVFDRVSFSYAETQVLHEIDLQIKKGQTVALVGPSGGGKSTRSEERRVGKGGRWRGSRDSTDNERV